MSDKSCPTCGCDTYNETGQCESALQLTEAKACIAELEGLRWEDAVLSHMMRTEHREMSLAKARVNAIVLKHQARIKELKTRLAHAECDEEQASFVLKGERDALQSHIDEFKKVGAFNEFREVMFKVHNLLGVSTDQTFKDIAEEMYTKIEAHQAQIEAAVEAIRQTGNFKGDGTWEISPEMRRVLKSLTGETGKGGD